MGQGPPAPLGYLHGRSSAGTSVLLMLIVARGCVELYSRRFTHFAASTVSYPDTSAIRSCRPAVSHSPPNPTFAFLAEYRDLPVTRPADHARRRADLEY